MTTARFLATASFLITLTGCLMPSGLLAQQAPLPAGSYYVEQQDEKVVALATQRDEWIEIRESEWFAGAGMYTLGSDGTWELDLDATAAFDDQTLQLNDARPASPGG